MDQSRRPPDEEIQGKAEDHLVACNKALFEGETENGAGTRSPAFYPYDGCETCVVREVLLAVWDDLMELAREEVKRER